LLFSVAILVTAASWLRAQVTVPMSQYDYGRTGANLNEWILRPSTVDSNSFGNLGTPFIDVPAGTLYIVTMTRREKDSNLWVHALDIYNGNPKFNSPSSCHFHLPELKRLRT
jgi:hypothetical protein